MLYKKELKYIIIDFLKFNISQDASPGARTFSRKAFEIFKNKWPDKAEKFYFYLFD